MNDEARLWVHVRSWLKLSWGCSGVQLLNMWWVCLLLYRRKETWLHSPLTSINLFSAWSVSSLQASRIHPAGRKADFGLTFSSLCWGIEIPVNWHLCALWRNVTFAPFRCAKRKNKKLLATEFCYFNWVQMSLCWLSWAWWVKLSKSLAEGNTLNDLVSCYRCFASCNFFLKEKRPLCLLRRWTLTHTYAVYFKV